MNKFIVFLFTFCMIFSIFGCTARRQRALNLSTNKIHFLIVEYGITNLERLNETRRAKADNAAKEWCSPNKHILVNEQNISKSVLALESVNIYLQIPFKIITYGCQK